MSVSLAPEARIHFAKLISETKRRRFVMNVETETQPYSNPKLDWNSTRLLPERFVGSIPTGLIEGKMHFVFEMLCYYLLMSFVAGTVLALNAPNQAKLTDIVVAALVWPYTLYKFYQHLKTY